MAERGLVTTVDKAIAYARDHDPPDRAELARWLEEVRAAAARTEGALQESEREVRNLSNLYVMHVRLFADLTSKAVAEAVQEIIINFMGSEDFVFYIRQGEALVPRAGQGQAMQQAVPLSSGDGPLQHALLSPEPSYSTHGSVALASFRDGDGKSVGLLDVKTLMRHKRWLNGRDKELLSILRTQAGVALGLALEREHRR